MPAIRLLNPFDLVSLSPTKQFFNGLLTRLLRSGGKGQGVEYCVFVVLGEFFNGCAVTRMLKKVIVPGIAADADHGIRKSDRRLARPAEMNRFAFSLRKMHEPIDDQRVQQEQTRLDTKHAIAASPAGGFQASRCLKRPKIHGLGARSYGKAWIVSAGANAERTAANQFPRPSSL